MEFNLEVPIKKIQRREELLINQLLEIKPEPENLVDKNALRIETPEGIKVGYVPAEVAFMLAPALKQGEVKIIRAFISEVNRKNTDELLYAKLIIQQLKG